MCGSCRAPSISAQLIKTKPPTIQRKYTAAEQKKIKSVLPKTQTKKVEKAKEAAKVKAKEAAKAKAREAAKAKAREAAKAKLLKKSKRNILQQVSLRQIRRI
jgi:hypothetical protein